MAGNAAAPVLCHRVSVCGLTPLGLCFVVEHCRLDPSEAACAAFSCSLHICLYEALKKAINILVSVQASALKLPHFISL